MSERSALHNEMGRCGETVSTQVQLALVDDRLYNYGTNTIILRNRLRADGYGGPSFAARRARRGSCTPSSGTPRDCLVVAARL